MNLHVLVLLLQVMQHHIVLLLAFMSSNVFLSSSKSQKVLTIIAYLAGASGRIPGSLLL